MQETVDVRPDVEIGKIALPVQVCFESTQNSLWKDFEGKSKSESDI